MSGLLWVLMVLAQPEVGPVVAPPPLPPIPKSGPVSTGEKDLFIVRFEPPAAREDGANPQIAVALVRRTQRALRACYERMLKSRVIIGRGRIRISVDARGRIETTEVVEDGLTDRQVLPCMARVFRRAHARQTGEAYTIELPFVFAPAE